MKILESMKNENAFEEWEEVKRSWQKFAEEINDKGIDNYNKKYYYNNVKRGDKNDGKRILQ